MSDHHYRGADLAPDAVYRGWADQLASYRRLVPLIYDPRSTMPDESLVPPHNPHRRGNTNTYAAEQRASNFHPGLTIDDLHVLLESRERRGYSAGYTEREERAHAQLEQCFDSAWAQGATAQHDATTNALGARVHVLAELARLVVPAALSRQGAEQAEVAYTLCDAIAGALDTLVEEHDAGPHRAPRDPRPSPTPLTPDEVASLGVQAPEPDEHARALELRDWLLEAVRRASNEPASCPTCADEGDGSA